MTTRATMKTEIIDELDRDASDGTRVLKQISAAIKHYQPSRFFFNESRSVTFATVDAQDIYTFGTGNDIVTEFYKIDFAELTQSGQDYALVRTSYVDIEKWADSSTTKARPTHYAYIDQALRLYRTPDAAYTVRLTGHIKLAEPAADDTAGNEWFTEAYELIKCRAKALLSIHDFADRDMARDMLIAEKSALDSLNDATRAKVASNRIMARQF